MTAGALRAGGWVGLAALALYLPYTLGPSNQSLYSLMGLAVIVAVGLSLLMGFAGQVSLGQGAFYALGAYTSGILAVRHHDPLLALAIAPFLTAAVAAVIGVPLLRLRGHYLAFATLALHLILLAVIFTWDTFTGGQIGLIGIPPLEVGGTQIKGHLYAATVWACAILTVLVAVNLVRSRAGRGLQLIATSEATAAAVGVNVTAYKLKLFVLSAGFAGLAGGLYTYLLQYLSPDSFPVVLSVQFVVMVAIGGIGSVYGAVVGAVAITYLQHLLQKLSLIGSLPVQAPRVASIGLYALILILVMVFMPRGLLPTLLDAARRARPQRMKSPPLTS